MLKILGREIYYEKRGGLSLDYTEYCMSLFLGGRHF